MNSAGIARDAETGRSRGFAQVEMANDSEADRAISALNGYVLDGRPLLVSETTPHRDHRRGDDGGAVTPGIQALLDALEIAGEEAGSFRPADPAPLERATEASLPRELLEFFRRYEPDGYVELNQRLCGAVQAVLENTDAVPGIGLFLRPDCRKYSEPFSTFNAVGVKIRAIHGEYSRQTFPPG